MNNYDNEKEIKVVKQLNTISNIIHVIYIIAASIMVIFSLYIITLGIINQDADAMTLGIIYLLLSPVVYLVGLFIARIVQWFSYTLRHITMIDEKLECILSSTDKILDIQNQQSIKTKNKD